jgi:hypothetical protein
MNTLRFRDRWLHPHAVRIASPDTRLADFERRVEAYADLEWKIVFFPIHTASAGCPSEGIPT